MEQTQATRLQFEAIGTAWEIDLYDSLASSKYHPIKQEIFSRIEQFDKCYSRFREDSLVLQIAEKGGKYQIPQDGLDMLKLYKSLYDLSRGLFTPLIGNLLTSAGYDASYSFHAKELKKPVAWDEALELKDKTLIVKEPILLDFGALGKGQLIDQLGKLLGEQEVQNYCIDGGGDILYKHHAQKSLMVGLEHPENPQQVIGVAHLSDGSLCASSGNRRKWGKYHHIMNPSTLDSSNSVLATWVIADTAMKADALATCLFLVDPEKLSNHFSFTYLMLKPDYSVQMSPDFPCELYYNKQRHA